MHEISQINSFLVIVLQKTIYNKICLLVEQMHFRNINKTQLFRKLVNLLTLVGNIISSVFYSAQRNEKQTN